ncbi:SDR family NAD(P)-dependent oxidoreductase [Ramlibacter tataouinensis]|uniref:Dehydrogenases with different specificities (Related to short-chain alcohol dehydrogenases)-like protein n=1 Tax=Ramlibacter tataouinensis (strain ATCC BAA-407 / DSM 14655 / LMG 21543 / TTB310) TaxID=365046 RepID=F5Y4F7_RAMTT|nr:SDR family NAD(P)-dependent oxidoreductase [Ramlibacter tataouinensis]AEG93804.1 dehydrogenases with different specificities (related to short-chain alcohol dehydrogenases)-like protein [Ramlibacter tataouinensis TTB310]
MSRAAGHTPAARVARIESLSIPLPQVFDMRPGTPLARLLPLLLACWLLALGGCATVGHVDRAEVAGKTYVVTGASSGIGRGVAEKLGSMGANVVLVARRTELLREVAAEVQARGGQALPVTADVSRADDMARVMRETLARFGPIHVWINNAAVGTIGRFVDVPLEDHARVVDVNLKGVIHGSHVALRQFRQQGFGSLVNMGSIESESPLAYHASYASTKAAILALGRALNEELRLAGLRKVAVSTVMPWAVDTPFFQHASNHSGREPAVILPDDPRKVADAVVWVSLHPREEFPVGWKANLAYAGHRVAPDLSERLSADVMHRYQMEKAPPAPATSGSLHRPVEVGRGVDGGHREPPGAVGARPTVP